MKRLVPLLLSVSLLLSLLCACGSADVETTVIPSDPSGEAAASQPADDAQEPSLALPSQYPEETHHVEETHHAEPEPTHHPEETHHAEAEPTHHGTTPAPTPKPTPAPTLTPAPAASVDLEAFYDDLVFEDADFNASMQLTGDFLSNYYSGLSGIATKQVVIYQPMMSGVVCEIALVEVENSADVAAVKNIFQQRINYQVGTDDEPGGAWYPSSIEGWKNNSRIVSKGNYVMLIAYEKCDSVVAQFNALF